MLELLKRGLDTKKIIYESSSGKKSELNILGVFLSRAILESELDYNDQWHGFLDENNRLHQLLDYEEIINFLIQKYKGQPFEAIRIHKNSYEIEEMIKIKLLDMQVKVMKMVILEVDIGLVNRQLNI